MKLKRIIQTLLLFLSFHIFLHANAYGADFFDDFSVDTTAEYSIADLWTPGIGFFVYDAVGERAQVLTGDNVSIEFSHDLPAFESGTFSIDLLPTTKYPNWGLVRISLVQDALNYYSICNTDGSGPCGEIKKVINGQVVESVSFVNEYSQNTNYQITIDFSPGQTQVEAFGEVHVLSTDNSSIIVSGFEVESAQQDAYYDNIAYFSDPFVIIVEPTSYFLQEQADLTVKAIAGQLQAGWGVKFDLDSSVTIVDLTPPFDVIFTSLALGEHVIDAFVIDDLGVEIIGAATHDTIINVGIGDYYVAMGDSITNGLDDDVPSDDSSSDGRNTGGGYTPILNNLLTAFKGYPHNIVNEGVPGASSVDGVFDILEVLSRHQNASRFLVQYGTNDASVYYSLPRPSGLGIDPGDPGYPGTFKDNMQQIIDAINEASKEVSLAKIPIALADCNSSCEPYPDPSIGQKNIVIQEYNEVIEELFDDPLNNIVVTPPDFYAYFSYFDSGTGRFRFEDEYATNYHPNGIGYQSMADLWFQALTQ
ncbi:MAG: SGNH/GDSL hydrolase family protein [Desulfobacterales bacterium]